MSQRRKMDDCNGPAVDPEDILAYLITQAVNLQHQSHLNINYKARWLDKNNLGGQIDEKNQADNSDLRITDQPPNYCSIYDNCAEVHSACKCDLNQCGSCWNFCQKIHQNNCRTFKQKIWMVGLISHFK